MESNRSYLLVVLLCLFGIGSWITVNGMWVEAPLLVNQLPEGWKLPLYATTLVQIANIGPLMYMAIYHFGSFKKKLERFTIYLILSISIITTILLSIFWNYKSNIFIFGSIKQTSVAFLVLVFILSFLDTTSSVTFVPYLVNYPSQYITALYVGEGLSGLIPGIVGLIQGVGGDPYCVNKTTEINGTNHVSSVLHYPSPNFTISEFLVFLCALLIICLISFSVIDNFKYFDQFKLASNSTKYEKLVETFEIEEVHENDEIETESLLVEKSKTKSKKRWIIYLLIVVYITFFTNGVLPSIQSYCLLQYSTTLYHVVITMSQILNPLASLLTVRKWKISDLTLFIMTAVASIAIAYEIFLASNSPIPVLNTTIFGEILAGSAWIIIIFTFTFEKAWLALQLQNEGHTWLQFHGASGQIGSACGALSSFILIGILNIFKSKPNTC